jgi:hypothetical protein
VHYSQRGQFLAVGLNLELLSGEVEVAVVGHQPVVLAELQVRLLEEEVECSVDDREEAALFVPLQNLVSHQSSDSPQVPGTGVGGGISDDAVSSFEELVRKGVRLVFDNGAQKTWQQGGSACLELLGLGVADGDQFGLVGVEDVGGDVGFRAESEVEDLVELGLRHLLPEEIGEFVEPHPVSDGRAGRQLGVDLGVAVADRDVLEDVAFMKHVSSPERRQNLVLSLSRFLGSQAGSRKVVDDLFGLETGSDQRLGLLMLQCERFGRNVGSQELLPFQMDFHGLHLEGLGAVLRKRPDEGVEADKGLGSVEGSYFDKDVFGVYRYF